MLRTNRRLRLISAMALAGLPSSGFASVPPQASDAGQAAAPALRTRWAADVSREAPLPEYPRPHMVREQWMNLNGVWQWAETKADAAPEFGKDLAEKIVVPFPVESALSGVGRQVERMTYRRTFTLPKEWAGKRVLLHFGAVDWETKVYVNGMPVGQHRGGYDPFTFDITGALGADASEPSAGGETSAQRAPAAQGRAHELIVTVFDPSDAGEQPRGKQVKKPESIWYTPCTGIWQTVWLEPVSLNYIERLVIEPVLDKQAIKVDVTVGGEIGGEFGMNVQVLDADKEVTTGSGSANGPLLVQIPDPKVWSPGSPFCYTVEVWLPGPAGADEIDRVISYFGMRKIEVAKDDNGVNRLFLNGKPYFQVGPLDQGFWPDGIYTAPTDEALRYDIEMTKKLGFNMCRKHVKVEPARWYYWADKLGLLVWQDMPSGNNRTPEGKKQFEVELQRMIETHSNHPSIVMWVVFNEGWGQYDTERLTKWVKELDPTRLVNNASGWTDMKVGDVMDVHSYPNPACPPTEPARAAVLGEFGGLGLPVAGHMWKEQQNWGYKMMADAERLTANYEKLLKGVYELKESSGLAAAVYTQTTDVEIEANGLMTYDRAVVKPDLERVAAVNRGDFSRMPPPPNVIAIVPTSEHEPQVWRYTTEMSASEPSSASWLQPGFDHSRWKEGPGGFGTRGTPGAIVRTEWSTGEIWLRREFQIGGPSESPSGAESGAGPNSGAAPAGSARVPAAAGDPATWRSPHLRVHHDEDCEVYINGVLALKLGGYTTEYEEFPLGAEARAAIKTGRNTLAVYCKQTRGGQYIDVGLVDLIPAKEAR